MVMEIAAFVSETGDTLSIYEPGKIAVFEKRQGAWTAVRESRFAFSRTGGMQALRQQMLNIVSFMNGCKVFVASSITGIPYFELEKAGCSVWEFAGRPQEFLDYIVGQESAEQCKQASGPDVVPEPVDIGGGHFHISLRDIQTSASGVTSKQALLPFLGRGEFYALEVICSHVPPWLEAELLGGEFSCTTERTGIDEFKLIITKNCCDG